jgi:hypothetical protein
MEAFHDLNTIFNAPYPKSICSLALTQRSLTRIAPFLHIHVSYKRLPGRARFGMAKFLNCLHLLNFQDRSKPPVRNHSWAIWVNHSTTLGITPLPLQNKYIP